MHRVAVVLELPRAREGQLAVRAGKMKVAYGGRNVLLGRRRGRRQGLLGSRSGGESILFSDPSDLYAACHVACLV